MFYARIVWKSGFSWKNDQLSNPPEYHFKKGYLLCLCCWWLFSFVAFFVFAKIVPSIKGQWGTWSVISTGQDTDWEQHRTKFWGKYLCITEMKRQEHREWYVTSSIIIWCFYHMWRRWSMGRARYVALKGGKKDVPKYEFEYMKRQVRYLTY